MIGLSVLTRRALRGWAKPILELVAICKLGPRLWKGWLQGQSSFKHVKMCGPKLMGLATTDARRDVSRKNGPRQSHCGSQRECQGAHGTKEEKNCSIVRSSYMAEQNEGRSFPSYRDRSELGPLPLRVHTASMLTTPRACPDQRWKPWVMRSKRIGSRKPRAT